MYTDLATLCVTVEASLREVIAQSDKSKRGIVLVTDEQRHLVGTITDGDIRRAVLDRLDLDQPVKTLLARKTKTRYATPITAPVTARRQTWLSILREHNILHLPLLDEEQRVAGLITLEDFVPNQALPLQALIMAGGVGRRLRPLTDEMPKPMLPVGDRPLMEIMIQQLREAGITRLHISTHHQQEKISSHFGDGREFGIELHYVTEERPLGTAGALGLMECPKETLLVINGDILTRVDFRAMLAYHREHQADLTIAVRQYDLEVPYGVVQGEGVVVHGVTEKPVLSFFVNAGIYLLEPIVYQCIQNGQPLEMPDLIQRLLKDGRSIVSFPVREYWLDVGRHTDYQRAQEDVKHQG